MDPAMDDDYVLDSMSSDDDDLVEIFVNPSNRPSANPSEPPSVDRTADGLILPRPVSQRDTPPTSQPPHPRSRRSRSSILQQHLQQHHQIHQQHLLQHHQIHMQHVQQMQTQQQLQQLMRQRMESPRHWRHRAQQQIAAQGQPTAIIDLTEEPDSPERPQRSESQGSAGRPNPRRTNSLRSSPPRLSRSDSTFFGPQASVIDLTEDAPEEQRPSDSTRSRTNAARAPPPPQPRRDELFDIEYISSAPRPGARPPGYRIGIRGGFANLAGLFTGELLGFNAPSLDVTRNAFGPREPSPKPPMEPVAPAREGFTRDTCVEPEKDSEMVVVCPACSEELAYDPTGTVTQSSTGGRKRKRAPGEHHFWALKKCGHVYCADCFENRRPTKANPAGAGFVAPDGRDPYSAANDLRCAVDGCGTKVSAKGEWVGIFL